MRSIKLASERFIALVAICIAGLSLATQFLTPRPATASAPGPGVSAGVASGVASELGPADAVLLNDAKPAKGADGKPVRVSADGGRVRWSDQPTAKAWAVAAIHVDKAMKGLLQPPTYADKRKELEDEGRKQDEEFGKRLEAMKQKYGNLDPSSPDVQVAQAEFNALREEYNKWREGSMRINEKLVAEQIEQAYRELVNAVEIVSDREGIDLVLRFMPTAEPFAAESLAGAREQVVGRTFLRYPEAIDITSEVMKELGVQP